MISSTDGRGATVSPRAAARRCSTQSNAISLVSPRTTWDGARRKWASMSGYMLIGATAAAPRRMIASGMLLPVFFEARLPMYSTVSALAAARTTFLARATAAPRAASSFGPRADGSGKRRSTPMARGRPPLMTSSSLPCRARGNGQGSCSSSKESSSIVTMMIGAVGDRWPRSSKRRFSVPSSAVSSAPASVRPIIRRAAAPPVTKVRGLGSSANGILLTIRPSVTRGGMARSVRSLGAAPRGQVFPWASAPHRQKGALSG